MIIHNLLNEERLKAVLEVFYDVEFTDGEATATEAAKSIKNNQQADPSDPKQRQLVMYAQSVIAEALVEMPQFQAWARPKAIIDIMFSRYDEGEGYGWHVDNPQMKNSRTDLSFTLFLSDPSDYALGTLDVMLGGTMERYKLSKNCAVIYPANRLHRVETLESGTRMVAVGWIQSYIRDHEKRELLFDLETARSSLYAKHGRTPEHEQLTRSEMNLLRMWTE